MMRCTEADSLIVFVIIVLRDMSLMVNIPIIPPYEELCDCGQRM